MLAAETPRLLYLLLLVAGIPKSYRRHPHAFPLLKSTAADSHRSPTEPARSEHLWAKGKCSFVLMVLLRHQVIKSSYLLRVSFASSSRLHHTSWWCMFLPIVVTTVTSSSTGSELMLFTKLALFANFLWLDIIGLCPRAGPHSSSAQCQLQVCFFLFYLSSRSNSY